MLGLYLVPLAIIFKGSFESYILTFVLQRLSTRIEISVQIRVSYDQSRDKAAAGNGLNVGSVALALDHVCVFVYNYWYLLAPGKSTLVLARAMGIENFDGCQHTFWYVG
jgi:hypothetical protein